MPIPKWIPKAYKQMMVTVRPYDPTVDDIDDLLLRDFQKEAMLQKEFDSDKGRAIKNNMAQIKKVRSFIQLAQQSKKDSKAQERLEEWLERLYVERFGLLRNEYLNWAKKMAVGMQTGKVLLKIPGSPQWQRERQKEQRQKRESRHKT